MILGGGAVRISNTYKFSSFFVPIVSGIELFKSCLVKGQYRQGKNLKDLEKLIRQSEHQGIYIDLWFFTSLAI